MTIYWERCSICSRYHVVKECILHNDLLVCPHCCISCPYRNKCPRPAWIFEITEKKPVEVKKPVVSKKRAEKVLLDLLSRLESDKEKK